MSKLSTEERLLNAIFGERSSEKGPSNMATKFRGVRDGTPFGDPLCRTCRHAHYIRGQGASQVDLFCDLLPNPDKKWGVPYEVYDCSRYDDKRLPSKNAMEKTAWILRSDALTKRIGFLSPAQRRKEGEYTGYLPDDD